MTKLLSRLCLLIPLAWGAASVAAQDDPSLEDNMCVMCHGTEDLWEDDTKHLFVGPTHLANDIHWQKGLRCQDCHGGDDETTELREAHATENGFRTIETPADVPAFCGHCHADAEKMHKSDPDAPLDIVDRFWTSVHGQSIKKLADETPADPATDIAGAETPEPVTCNSCHAVHQMRASGDPLSQTHPTQLAATCGACHTQQRDTLLVDVHSKAGEENEQGEDAMLSCAKCHGDDMHGMLAVRDPLAPTSVHQQMQSCGSCHQQQRDGLLAGAHGSATQINEQGETVPLGCTGCHSGTVHGMLPVKDPKSPVFAGNLADSCGRCHSQQRDSLLTDVHGKAGEKNAQGEPTVLSCAKCHGSSVHEMLPVKDRQSPVFLDHQIKNCGTCHEEDVKTYMASVHGQGLEASGLLVTAVCADCHGAHGILPADDDASTLHAANVAGTCAKCHRFIEERLKSSVHGSGNGLGQAADRAAPGGETMRTPSCNDCHQKHDAGRAGSAEFRQAMANRCGDCHQELSHQFAISVHGELTELGYGPAAKCADCHGDHEILPLDDPNSMLSAANRAQTCGKCHPGAAGNFLDFDPHADHRNPERSPMLYAIYLVLLTFLLGTIGFFGLHSVLWFIRSLIEVKRHGREHSWKPGAVAYVRFSIFHRVAHAALLVSFLGLAMTGLPLKYSSTEWAQVVADMLGGFSSTSAWHRIFGMVNVGCLAVYLVRMFLRLVAGQRAGIPLRTIIFGPDSPIPNWRDLKDFIAMVRWFFGLGPKPTFERWAYWEKVDFWGASADIVIIGLTGLILWFPYVFCAFLPGEVLNVAKVIHSTQALLATGFVFAIHFFATHLRPEKFPMDMVMLTGMVSDEELREERPEMLERLEREGKLEALRTTIPAKGRLLSLALGGAIGLFVGLALLVGILVGVFGG